MRTETDPSRWVMDNYKKFLGMLLVAVESVGYRISVRSSRSLNSIISLLLCLQFIKTNVALVTVTII